MAIATTIIKVRFEPDSFLASQGLEVLISGNSNFFFMQDADRSYLFILPNELLAAIASELLVIQHGDVVDAYHLAVFSLTCRRVYLSTRSVLFNHVPLASEAQIESLSLVPERLLKCIRYVTQHCRQGRFVS